MKLIYVVGGPFADLRPAFEDHRRGGLEGVVDQFYSARRAVFGQEIGIIGVEARVAETYHHTRAVERRAILERGYSLRQSAERARMVERWAGTRVRFEAPYAMRPGQLAEPLIGDSGEHYGASAVELRGEIGELLLRRVDAEDDRHMYFVFFLAIGALSWRLQGRR